MRGGLAVCWFADMRLLLKVYLSVTATDRLRHCDLVMYDNQSKAVKRHSNASRIVV